MDGLAVRILKEGRAHSHVAASAACLLATFSAWATDAIVIVGTSAGETIDLSSQNLPHHVYAKGGSDTVYGSSAGDLLDGAGGADRLFGNDGDDVLIGGGGNDQLSGGRGHDTLRYSGKSSGFDDNAGGDGIDIVIGSPNDDIIGIGSITSVEVIDGQAGYDVLQMPSVIGQVLDLSSATLYGIELIAGGTWADVITGSDGDDVIEGRGGNDLIYGRGGRDIAAYSGESAEYSITNLGGSMIVKHLSGTDGTDTLTNVEVVAFLDARYEGGAFLPRYPDNSPPFPNADSAVVAEDGVVEIDVLANDWDADGESLSIRSFGQAANGTVTKGSFSTLVYTPKRDFNGADSFTYEVSDPRYGRATATATVTVMPAPDVPIAVDDRAEAFAGDTVLIDVLQNDLDPDGDALQITHVGTPARGSATIAGSKIQYSAPEGYSGTLAFIYTVRDASGSQASAQIVVTVTSSSLGGEFLQLLSAAPEGSWLKINKNFFSDVWAPSDQRPVGATLPARIISAWSSMAWDPNRGDLIFWGGGHKNYSGNEVYRFRTSNQRWERASLPSDIYQPLGDQQWFAVDGPFNAPTASHTYDNQEFLPISDRFITFGGAKYNEQERFVLLDGGTATGPYLWDPSRADGQKVGGTTGSQVRPGSYANVLGGKMWENRHSAEIRGTGDVRPTGRGRWVNGVTAYGEHDGRDAIYLSDTPVDSGRLYRFTINDLGNPDFDNWELIGIKGPGHSNQGAGAFDPDRNLFVRTANSSVGYVLVAWDVARAGPANKSFHVRPSVDSGLQITKFHGIDYDSQRKAFVLWDGGPNIWYVTPPIPASSNDWRFTKVSPASAGSGAPAQADGILYSGSSQIGPWGILGKWKYARNLDVFFGVQDPVRGDVWVFKPIGWSDP